MTHISVVLTGPNQPCHSPENPGFVPSIRWQDGDDSWDTAGHSITDVLARSAEGRCRYQEKLGKRFQFEGTLNGGRCSFSWKG